MERGIDRLRQLVEGGAPTYVGRPNVEYDNRTRILAVFPDGTKELALAAFRIKPTVELTGSWYRSMIKILQREDIDFQKLRVKSQVHVQWHVLEMPDGQIYRSLLPSLYYKSP